MRKFLFQALTSFLCWVWFFDLTLHSQPVAPRRSGEETARLYCQNCHLFPEPKLLDQHTWLTHSLRLMAPFLGVGRMDFSNRPDGQILEKSGLFPKEPLMSKEDWYAIMKYYGDNAPAEPLPQAPREPISTNLAEFKARPIAYMQTASMCSLVQIDSVRRQIITADWTQEAMDILDQAGARKESFHLSGGPVALLERKGRFYATLIGHIFPTDEPAGSLVSWDATDPSRQIQPILTNLPRPTWVNLTDMNGDGRDDLVLCFFGNKVGRFSWFESKGSSYEEHVLLDRPGAIRSYIVDANNDGNPDILVLMAQAREGIYLFVNDGKGSFTMRTILEEHPLFGFSYFELVDFNKDGFPDILVTNGDNGEYQSPMKNYHGIRLLLNDGQWNFKQTWFYPLNGAFRAMAADFDGDGDLDIAAISFFPDYEKSPEESFVYLENQGEFKFKASSFPESTAGRWVTMDVGDLNGDGRPDIVLGSFSRGPVSIPIPRSLQERWETNHVSLMLLENRARKKE